MNNLINQKFGKLTVIEQAGRDKHRNIVWLCRCECGNTIIVRSYSLLSGQKGCKCLLRESGKKRSHMNIKHGYSLRNNKSRLYTIWECMISRCSNVNRNTYINYIVRGISVCNRWKKFDNFLTDMGEPPTHEHSIDRINNDLGYHKNNCRWATKKQQARNQRRNKLITLNDKTQCIAAWAEEYQINYNTLWGRLYKLNWSLEKSLQTSGKTNV